MLRPIARLCTVLCLLVASTLSAADWTGFRGLGGMGMSDAKNVPLNWSSTENIVWQVDLPGPGASSPITLGDRVFITCYSGYGLKPNEGDQKNLRRHLLCLDRNNGKIIWKKQFEPKLPEHAYQGEGSYQGYAGSTPTTDGERLYVFFGKSGVYCFDLEGNETWHVSVGEGTSGWGSGGSPVLYGNLLFINASVESGSMFALDKLTGKEVWKTRGIGSAWNTPLVIGNKDEAELVVSIQDHVVALSPGDGKEIWRAEGVHRYVCPSVVSHDKIVYAIGGGSASLAVRAGGKGTVTESHGVWRKGKGSNVCSPIYYEGHLYSVSDEGGVVCCQNAANGDFVFQTRPEPAPVRVWSSPVLVDGKLYIVSQHSGTYVVAAKPKYELLAHNVFADDDSRTNASPAVGDGRLYLRTDRRLYCIGAK